MRKSKKLLDIRHQRRDATSTSRTSHKNGMKRSLRKSSNNSELSRKSRLKRKATTFLLLYASRHQMLLPPLSKTFITTPLRVNLSWLIIMRSKNWESYKEKKPWISPTSSNTWLRRPVDSIWTTWSPILTWLRSSNNFLKSCNKTKQWTPTSTLKRETWIEDKEDNKINTEEATKIEDQTCKAVKIWEDNNHIWEDNNTVECQVHMAWTREWIKINNPWPNQCQAQLQEVCQESHKEVCSQCQELQQQIQQTWTHQPDIN